MTEAELAIKFIDYFEGHEIYKEVPTYYGRCDFFAVRDPLHISVEVKKQFSTQVIYQALRNFDQSNYAYVAVPKPADGYAATQICKSLGIGVLYYSLLGSGDSIEQEVVPAYRRKIIKPKYLDSMKEAIAGAQHNSMSEFKVTIEYLTIILRRNKNGLHLNELFGEDAYHYSSPKHAKQAIVRLVNKRVLPQFKIEKGIISLTA